MSSPLPKFLSRKRCGTLMMLIVCMMLPSAGMAQVGTPNPAFGPGSCGGSVPGFSPTFFGNWFDVNWPPTGCLDTEILGNQTQHHSFGRGADLQDISGVRRLIVGGWMEFNPSSGAGPWLQFALSAYDAAGDLDPTFGGGDGKVLTQFPTAATGQDVLVRDDNSIVTVGGDGTFMVMTAHTFDGVLDWQMVTPVSATLGARALVPKDRTPTSDFFVIGGDTSTGSPEIVVARFDALGNLLTQAIFGNPFFGTTGLEFYGLDIEMDAANGHLYLAGVVKDPAGPSKHMILIKTDDGFAPIGSFGGTSTVVPFGGVVTAQVKVTGIPRDSEARAVTLSPNGDVYLGGMVDVGGPTRMAAVRVDATTGSLIKGSFVGPAGSEAHEMLVDSRRRIVLVGETAAAAPRTPMYALARFDQDLNVDVSFGGAGTGWHATPGSGGPSRGFDIVRDEATGDLGLAGDTVIDPGSVPPYVTNWTQTGARWFGGPICGNGILEATEDCEAPFGDCCSVTCDFLPAATTCRLASDVCDVDDTCTGASDICPDAVAAATVTCRVVGGVCDVAETCDGTLKTCPANGFAPSSTLCRSAGPICDVEEYCTGLAPDCPADAPASAGTACGSSTTTDCDNPDSCDAVGNCLDNFSAAGTSCGSGVVTDCDLADTCDGAGSCDVNLASVGTACGDSSDTECTNPDTCDGAGACEDNHETVGAFCGDTGTECTVQDTCDGAGACDDNGFEPAGTPAPTLCDDGEACTGDVCDGAGGCDNSGAVSSAGFDHNEDGVTDASDDVDTDGDGIIDACDICMNDCNPDQLDTDADCSATGPWTVSGAPECGDVCDVCPASDEAAMATDPNCATFDYNSATDCCEETGAGVSVGAAGESCGGPAGNTDFSATGSTTSAAVRIPAGAVTDDTSFSADSKTKGGDEFFVRGGSGTYVGGWDFGPEGVTFGQPVVVCMTWNDPDNDGKLEKSEGYDYQITEATIAPYHIDSVGGEYKLADKCSKVPCTSFDADGFPDDWGGNTRYDEASTPSVDESTLGACCGATENKYCFEVYHFSTYALADPNCMSENLDRTKLKVLKLNKEDGDQKVVFSTDVRVPVAESGEPDPPIDPLQNGFSMSILDSDVVAPILWSANVEGGAYDKVAKTGWKANKAGTSWTYKGRNRDDGIIKVVVKSLYKKEPGLLKVKVVAKDASVPVVTSPIQAEISLDPTGFLDRCAMTEFGDPPASSFCVPNGNSSAVICR